MKTAEYLLLAIKGVVNATNEKLLQGESREVENLRVCEELASKLMNAEAVAVDIARESDVDKGRIYELESHIELHETTLKAMQEEITSLHDALSTKNQGSWRKWKMIPTKNRQHWRVWNLLMRGLWFNSQT